MLRRALTRGSRGCDGDMEEDFIVMVNLSQRVVNTQAWEYRYIFKGFAELVFFVCVQYCNIDPCSSAVLVLTLWRGMCSVYGSYIASSLNEFLNS